MKSVFVINLDRRKDRLEAIAQVLLNMNVKWRRFSAIDGRAIAFGKSVDWWKSRIYNEFRGPLYGAIGCFLSHRAIWEIIVREGIPEALILEDDVVPTTFWDPEILNTSICAIGLENLRLSSNFICGAMPASSYFEKVFGKGQAKNLNSWGTGAQIMTLEGARKCLKMEKIWFPVDDFFLLNRILGLRTALLVPQMWEHDGKWAGDITEAGYYEQPETLARKLARVGVAILREQQRLHFRQT